MQIGPKSSSISQYGLKNAVRTSNVLRNLDFQGQNASFDGTGVHVYQRRVTDTSEEKYLWKVESNTASSNTTAAIYTDYIVRGGNWIRETGDEEHKVPLTTDVGTWTGDYDDSYKSIVLPDDSNLQYVYVEIDSAMQPTTCEVKYSVSWPSYDKDKDYIVLAQIDPTTGIIYEYRRDEEHDFFASPDASRTPPLTESIHYSNNASNHHLQIMDFDSPSDKGTSETDDLILIRDPNSGTGNIPKVAYCSKVKNAENADEATHATTADNADYASYAGIASYANASGESYNHAELLDVMAGSVADDHGPANVSTGGWYVQNNGDYSRNRMLGGLGWGSNGLRCFDIANGQIADEDGITTIDFDDGCTLENNGWETVDWKNCQLMNNVWSVTNTEEITDTNPNSGSLQVLGGASFSKKIQSTSWNMLDGTNYWRKDDIVINITDDLSVTVGDDRMESILGQSITDVTELFLLRSAEYAYLGKTGAGTAYIRTGDTGNFNVNIGTDANLYIAVGVKNYIDGNPVTDELTGAYNLIDSDGNMFPIYLRRGWVEVL